MKILHLYRDLWYDGGVPYQTRCLIEGQIKAGGTLLSLALNGNSPEAYPGLLHPHHTCVVTSGMKSVFQLREILKAHKPDIVHITGLWIPIHQLWAIEVLRAKIPYVVSTHGNLSPLGRSVRFGGKTTTGFHIWRKNFWHWSADRHLLAHAVSTFVHSTYEAEIIDSLGVKNISIVPIGNNNEFEGSAKVRPRELHEPITFLHLGRLDLYHKGLDLICEALQQLSSLGHRKNLRVIFVGPTVGDSKRKLEEFAASLEEGTLEIRNAVWGEDKEILWNEVDYFFNLYRFAGMALSPSEALARGIPLVASREGNFGDWVNDRKMGFIAPLTSPEISNLILSILNISNYQYKQLSQNTLNFSHFYTWERVAQETLSIYKNDLGIHR